MSELLRPGSRMSHCSGCGGYFSSPRVFSEHRIGPYTDRRCQSEFEMRGAGFTRDSRGVWERHLIKSQSRAGQGARRGSVRDTVVKPRTQSITEFALLKTLYGKQRDAGSS